MAGEDRIIRCGVHEDNQSLPLPGTIKDARELPANRPHLAPSQNNISAAATAAGSANCYMYSGRCEETRPRTLRYGSASKQLS